MRQGSESPPMRRPCPKPKSFSRATRLSPDQILQAASPRIYTCKTDTRLDANRFERRRQGSPGAKPPPMRCPCPKPKSFSRATRLFSRSKDSMPHDSIRNEQSHASSGRARQAEEAIPGVPPQNGSQAIFAQNKTESDAKGWTQGRRDGAAGSRCKIPGEADLQEDARLAASLVKMHTGSCG